ncbi:hypothetical protein ACFL6U_19435, partial [Planctomycetota bacterium]
MSDTTTGIIKRISPEQHVLRTTERSYRQIEKEITVAPALVRKFGLTEGAAVTGQLQRSKGRSRLVELHSVAGLDPEAFRKRKR